MTVAHPELVDEQAARPTLAERTAQDAWTAYVVNCLRRKLSPGCHMRDLCAWWDREQAELFAGGPAAEGGRG